MYRSRDWVDHFLELSRVDPPGTVARYCTGGVVALGEVIARAGNEDFAAFAERTLWKPLGIEELRWQRFDRKRKVDSGGHLHLTPRSMAKIGLMVLQGGRWGDQQLVPTQWIAQSTRAQTQLRHNDYGYLWWIDHLPFGDLQVDVISARGNGGQAIFVVPDYDLVAVTTAGYYNSDDVRRVYEIVYHGVLASIPELRAEISRGDSEP